MEKLTRGVRNNNPLNIRKGNNWQGERQHQADTAFEEFSGMVWGLRAGFRIIKNYMQRAPKCDTLQKIITRWAPPMENDTQAYIDFVSKKTGIRSDMKLDFRESTKIVAIVTAMCQMESNYTPSLPLCTQAYEMAL